jgi:hypothetical protein
VAARSAVKEGGEVESLHASSDRDSDGVWPLNNKGGDGSALDDEDGDGAALGAGMA